MNHIPFSLIDGTTLGSDQNRADLYQLFSPVSELGPARIAVSINAETGNVFYRDHTKVLTEFGVPISVGAVYNSQGVPAWRVASAARLEPVQGQLNTAGSTVTYVASDGCAILYSFDAAQNVYVAVGAGAEGNSRLTHQEDGTWKREEIGSGLQETFDVSLRQTGLLDRQARGWLFTYNEEHQLSQVSGTSGQSVLYDYTDGTVRVGHRTNGAALPTPLMNYDLDAFGQVLNTHIPLDSTHVYSNTFHYDTTGRLNSVSQTDGSLLQWGYDTDNRITQIQDGAKRAWELTYAAQRLTITDLLHQDTKVILSESGRLESIRYATDRAESLGVNVEYDAADRLSTVTTTEGEFTSYIYDAEGYVTTRQRGTDQVTTEQHDPETGLLMARTQHASDATLLTTYSVYNDKQQCLYQISPSGRVTAYTYDASGNRIASRRYLGTSIDTSTFNSETLPTEVALQTWCTLQDQSNASLREYAYDASGRLTQKTQYAHLNSNGSGIRDELTFDETWGYNLFGQCEMHTTRQQVDSSAKEIILTETVIHDGLQRVLQQTNALQAQTSFVYDDANKTIKQTLPTGATLQKTLDANGRVLSETLTVDGHTETTSYTYDAAGGLSTKTMPGGQVYHYVTDSLQRVIAEIDPLGLTTQTDYDYQGRIWQTRRYATPLSVGTDYATLTIAEVEALSNPKLDQRDTTLYDVNGLKLYTIHAEGGVVEYQYDGAGRCVQEYQFYLEMDDAASYIVLDPKKNFKTPVNLDGYDRVLKFEYNLDGECIRRIDGEGYCTDSEYDRNGREIHRIIYADSTKPDPTNPKNSHRYYYYDLKGALQGEMDGERGLTVYERSANGVILKKTRYANRAGDPKLSSKLVDLIPETSTEDQVETFLLDALNRVTEHTFSNGRYEKTVYAEGYSDTTHVVDSRIGDQADATVERVTLRGYTETGLVLWELPPRAKTEAMHHTYGTDELRISTTDSLGHTTFYYYNQKRQLVFSINPRGAVTEYTYDSYHVEPTTQNQYATVISTDVLKILTGGYITDDLKASFYQLRDQALSENRNDQFWYDRTDTRQKKHIDAMGNLDRSTFNVFMECEYHETTSSNDHTLGQEIDYTRRGLVDRTFWEGDNGNLGFEDFTYDHLGEVVKKLYGNANDILKYVDYTRDHNGRVLTTTDALQRTAKTSWDALGRVATETDALQNTTEFKYDQSTHSTTTVTPAGVKTIEIQNVFGEWVERVDGNQKSIQCTRDPDGQIRVLTDELGNATENLYNVLGWQTSYQDANQLVSTWDHDIAGAVTTQTVVNASGNQTTIYPDINAFGEFTRLVDASGVTTLLIRDALGRILTTIIDPYDETTNPGGLHLITTQTFDTKNQVLSTVRGDRSNPALYSELTVVDALNRPITHIVDPEGLKLTKTFRYDENSNLVATVDEEGFTTRQIFDAANQLCYQIDACAGVTAYQYNDAGKRIEARHYKVAIALDTLTDQSTCSDIVALLKEDISDRITYTIRDIDGLPRYTIDRSGAVTEKQCDGASREIVSIAYAERIDVATVLSTWPAVTVDVIKQALVDLDHSKDRQTIQIRDAKGQVVYLIDGEGAVVYQVFSQTGKVTAETHFATRIDVNAIALPPTKEAIDLFVDQANPNNRVLHHVYDALDQLRYTIDGDLFVKEFQYDAMGRLTDEINYAVPLTGLPTDLTVVTLAEAVMVSEGLDKETHYQLDAAGRRIKVTDATGASSEMTLNALGQATSTKDALGNRWQKDFERDTARRNTGDITPAIDVTQVLKDPITGALSTCVQNTPIRTTYELDKKGLPVTVIQADGLAEARTSKHEYDAMQRLIKTTLLQVPVDDSNRSPSTDVDRPDQVMDLISERVYDGIGNLVATSDLQGRWSFKVYDGVNTKPRYEIDANHYVTESQYNAFGEVSRFVGYAHAVALDPTEYQKTGIDITTLQGLLTPDSTADRYVYLAYDRRGLKVSEMKAPKLTYTAGGLVCVERPMTQYEYTAFREVSAKITGQDTANQPIQSIALYNRQDLPAGVDISKRCPIFTMNESRYVTRYTLDYAGRELTRVEYAKPFPASLDPNRMTINEIDTALLVLKSSEDKSYFTEYDARGLVTKSGIRQVVTQVASVENGIPSMKDVPPTDISTEQWWDAKGQNIRTVDEEGLATHLVLNAKGDLTQKVEIPRVSEDEHGTSIILTPTTVLGVNPHGEIVSTIKIEQQVLLLRDSRGLVSDQQDARGALTHLSRTLSGQIRRFWQWVSHFQDDPGEPLLKKKRTERYEYDEVDQQTSMDYLNEHDQVTETHAVRFNAFGDKTGEGGAEGDYALERRFDLAGDLWFTNENQGIATISITNTRGVETVQLRAQTPIQVNSALKDLSEVTYDELPMLLQATDDLTIERTESILDASDQVVQRNLPPFHAGLPDDLFLVLSVGTLHSEFGQYSISWVRPDHEFEYSQIRLWVSGEPESETWIPAREINGRMGIDATAYQTDLYEAVIGDFFKDPRTGKLESHPRVSTHVKFSLITAHLENSQNPVLIKRDDFTFELHSKANITGVQLIEKDTGTVMGQVTLQTTDQVGVYQLDLRDYPTGNYTLQYIFGVQKVGTPFSATCSSEAIQGMALVTTVASYDDNGGSGMITWANLPPGFEESEGFIVGSTQKSEAPDEPGYWFSVSGRSGSQKAPDGMSHQRARAIYFRVMEAGMREFRVYPANAGYAKFGFAGPRLYIEPSEAIKADGLQVLDSAGHIIAAKPLSAFVGGRYCADMTGLTGDYQFQLIQQDMTALRENLSVDIQIQTPIQPVRLSTRYDTGRATVYRDDRATSGYVYWQMNRSLYTNTTQILLGFRLYPVLNNVGLWDQATDAPTVVQNTPVNLMPGFYDFDDIRNLNMDVFQGDYLANIPLGLNLSPSQSGPVYHYPVTRTLTIGPLTGVLIPTTTEWEYWDHILQNWRVFSGSERGDVLSVDVTKLPQGAYLWRFKAFNPIGEPIDLSDIATVDPDGFVYGYCNIVDDPSTSYGCDTYQNPATVLARPVERYEYDRDENVVAYTDPQNQTTTNTYNYRQQTVSTSTPPVMVTDDQGNPSPTPVSLVTRWGYNQKGHAIGTQKSKGNTTVHEVDSVGQITKTTRADGVSKIFVWNGYRQNWIIRDGAGNLTIYGFDLSGNQVSIKDPLGWLQTSQFNERQLSISETNGEGETTRYDYDERDQLVIIWQPNGNQEVFTRDRHGQVLTWSMANRLSLTYQRDYFGIEISLEDLGGALITYIRNGLKQITLQMSPGGNRVAQHLEYRYDEAAHPTWIKDFIEDTSVQLFVGVDGQLIGRRFIQNAEVFQDILITLDEAGRRVQMSDTRVVVYWAVDANGNIVGTNAYYYPPSGSDADPQNWVRWNLFNRADRLVVSDGINQNGTITIAPNQGTSIQYDPVTGYRIRDTYQDSTGHNQTRDYGYLVNGILQTIVSSSDQTRVTYTTDNAGRRTHELHEQLETQKPLARHWLSRLWSSEAPPLSVYRNKSRSTISYNTDDSVAEVHREIMMVYPNNHEDWQWITDYTQTYANYDGEQNILHQHNEYPETDQDGRTIAFNDDVETSYLNAESRMIANVALTRHSPGGDTHGNVSVTYDANVHLAGVSGDLDEDGGSRSFLTTPDGVVIYRKNAKGEETYFFSGLEGESVGAVTVGQAAVVTPNPQPDYRAFERTTSNYSSSTSGYDRGSGSRSSEYGGMASTVGQLNRDQDGNPSVNFDPTVPLADHWPMSVPTHTVADGEMSYAEIALSQYGDARYGNQVARANHAADAGDIPTAGFAVRLPNIPQAGNTDWLGERTYQSMGDILGSLYPTASVLPLKPKKKHHSWFENLVLDVLEVAEVVVCTLAPEVFGILAEANSFIGAMMIEGITAGFSNLIAQSTDVIAGRSSGINGKAILTAMISAMISQVAGSVQLGGATSQNRWVRVLQGMRTAVEADTVTQALRQITHIAPLSWQELLQSGVSGMVAGVTAATNETSPSTVTSAATINAIMETGVEYILNPEGINGVTVAANIFGTALGAELLMRVGDVYRKATTPQANSHTPESYAKSSKQKVQHLSSQQSHTPVASSAKQRAQRQAAVMQNQQQKVKLASMSFIGSPVAVARLLVNRDPKTPEIKIPG